MAKQNNYFGASKRLRIALWMAMILITAGFQLAACTAAAPTQVKQKPAVVEPIGESDLKRVVLTERAAERIGIQTIVIDEAVALVEQSQPEGAQIEMQTIPYAAVIYDINGDTWVYTNPDSLTFLRQHVMVDHISGERAFLAENLPTGTRLVTTGVAELYGAETGVGK